MFKIHPIEQEEVAREIYPELCRNEILFALNEGGKFTGYGVCGIDKERIFVKSISVPYDDARELMFLAMLSYAERRGVKTASVNDFSLADLCEKYEFDQNKCVSLEGFFLPGKHCLK